MSDPGSEYQTAKASFAIVVAMALLAIVDNFIARLAEDGGLWQFHLIRSAMAIPLLFALAIITRQDLTPHRWGALVLRSVIHALGLVIYFGSLGFLPLSQAGAGLFTSPFFVLLISVMFFGAPVGIWRILALISGFGGVIIVLNPDPSELSALSLIPCLAGLFYGLAMVATRQWCAQENNISIVLGVFCVLAVFGAIGLIAAQVFEMPANIDPYLTRSWAAPTVVFLSICFLQAVGSIAAVWLVTWAYKNGEASSVSIFEYSFLVFAPIFGVLFWGIAISAQSVLGISAIILSGVIIVLRTRSPIGA
ncbi:DMT family transporter [Cochlodiniinecator piscidefendens]|uniref:DMT family transporter n=1 Tax=Cochlodiniinecator piscidefendens TaxID=2715756 RepID=UPI00140CF7F2|nr:DMT family transporter [Cochlodiniinecator piscidefendens]